MNKKQIRTLERVFKGVANHWRIEILLLINSQPEITLEGITEKLKANYHTTSEHVIRLKTAGLINKKYKGKSVLHTLSPFGIKLVKIISTFLY
jgi:Mn-dependent DtxR family transcriptional regulator